MKSITTYFSANKTIEKVSVEQLDTNDCLQLIQLIRYLKNAGVQSAIR